MLNIIAYGFISGMESQTNFIKNQHTYIYIYYNMHKFSERKTA